MENKEQFQKTILPNLQNYFSLGYIFLLALGIMYDTIYYGFLEINILNYSSITDVLLSPLVLFTKSIKIPITLGICGILLYFLVYHWPKYHDKYKHNKWYKSIVNVEKWDKKYAKRKKDRFFLFMLLNFIAAFYLGSSVGAGRAVKEKLNSGSYKENATLTFNDGAEKKVKILGQNSEYLFYVADGEKNIMISPIASNIKKIEKIVSKD